MRDQRKILGSGQASTYTGIFTDRSFNIVDIKPEDRELLGRCSCSQFHPHWCTCLCTAAARGPSGCAICTPQPCAADILNFLKNLKIPGISLSS